MVAFAAANAQSIRIGLKMRAVVKLDNGHAVLLKRFLIFHFDYICAAVCGAGIKACSQEYRDHACSCCQDRKSFFHFVLLAPNWLKAYLCGIAHL
jgi:hypothetical protein